MRWIEGLRRSADLPAVWIVPTGEKPRTRPERSALRASISRSVLALQTGVDPAGIAIGHEASGQPRLIAGGLEGLRLSHATRGGVVAVGVARGPIGVDVERVGAGPVPMGALHRAEQLWLSQLATEQRDRAFAALWAAKEAYGKWSGAGLPETDAFALLPDEAGGWRVAGAPPARILTRPFDEGGEPFVAAAAFQGS